MANVTTTTLPGLISGILGARGQVTNFKIDTKNYLGMDHEAYKTKLFQLAITKPEAYFELREQVLNNVKTQAVATQYNIYYHLLSKGTKTDGSSYVVTPASMAASLPAGGLAGIFKPCVPLQDTNQFALKASKTIDAICEEAIEMLIPMDYKEIAEKRLKKRTEGNLGF